MPLVIEYLLKLSLSLAFMYLFYQLLLRRLTFYQHNRVYLLVYSLLSFIIPFINITDIPGFEVKGDSSWIQKVPAIYKFSVENQDNSDNLHNGISFWTFIYYLIGTGMMIFLIRLGLHLVSLSKIRRKSVRLLDKEIKVFQVDQDIIPFSFGQSIYINQQKHNPEELQDIIRHEFVHVKQLHTIDILWSELICIVNWYNPFAWLIRRAVRQNLEFIADNKVVQAGVDRKEYQYLLLKVMGNNHYSIANQFNFSSLKKRIAMMNKVKTSKVKLLRLLLLLPVVTITLLAFRQQLSPQKEPVTVNEIPVTTIKPVLIDTPPTHNSKGYNISIKDRQGNCTIVIKDKTNKVVKSVLLTDWDKNSSYYEDMYGELPPPPPPKPSKTPVAPVAPETPEVIMEVPVAPVKVGDAPTTAIPPVPPTPPVVVELPVNVKRIQSVNNKVQVDLKDGKVENYDLSKPEQKAQFEKKYGKLPEPPQPPPAPVVSVVNEKGYTFFIADKQGDCQVLVMDKFRTIRKVLLTDWNNNKRYYEGLYGVIPSI